MIPVIILAIEDEDDRDFMKNLHCSYRTLLYAEIIQILHDPWNAEDVMQNVIVKLIDHIQLLKKMDSRSLVNYIITAAKHTSYNFLRDSKPTVSLDDEPAAKRCGPWKPRSPACNVGKITVTFLEGCCFMRQRAIQSLSDENKF